MLIEPLGNGGITHYTYNLIVTLKKKDINLVLFTTKNYEFLKMRHDFKLYTKMFTLSNKLIKVIPSLDREEQIYGLGLNFKTVQQRGRIMQLHVDHPIHYWHLYQE